MNTLQESTQQDFILAFDTTKSNIRISGYFGSNPITFIGTIINRPFFSEKNILILENSDKKQLRSQLKKSENEIFDAIFIAYEHIPYKEIILLFKKYNINGRIVFFEQNWEKQDENIVDFKIKNTSFREFSKEQWDEIIIRDILQKNVDMQVFEKRIQQYLFSWSFTKNIIDNSAIINDFEKILQAMSSEVFESERENFRTFIKHIYSIIGQLYKEDAVAKEIGVSRRKIKKYRELLEKYKIISLLEPYYTDTNLELSRHSKIYFSDLAFLRWAHPEGYMVGKSYQAVIENFAFLELKKRLDDSHELYFWRKKSGTQISFIIKNIETWGINPIDLSLYSDKFNPALRSFYQSYHQEIEHGMLLHENKIAIKNESWKPFFILPYWAI